MAQWLFPTHSRCTWHVVSNLLYGIPPFATFDVDFTKKKGTCKWGKRSTGTISNIDVHKGRKKLTASFAIWRRYRDQELKYLKGKISARVKDDKGAIELTVSGMPSYWDNTDFDATMSASKLVTAPKGGGKCFDVTFHAGAAGKLGAQATLGNLVVRDMDLRIEDTYPAVTAGTGLAAGITLKSTTTFNQLKLKLPFRDWSGSKIDLKTIGASFLVGWNAAKMVLTTPSRRKIVLESSGFGVSLEAKADLGSLQLGTLGPRTSRRPF